MAIDSILSEITSTKKTNISCPGKIDFVHILAYSKLSFCFESKYALLLHKEFMNDAGPSIKSFSELNKSKKEKSFSPSLISATFIGARNPNKWGIRKFTGKNFLAKTLKLTKPLSLE